VDQVAGADARPAHERAQDGRGLQVVDAGRVRSAGAAMRASARARRVDGVVWAVAAREVRAVA